MEIPYSVDGINKWVKGALDFFMLCVNMHALTDALLWGGQSSELIRYNLSDKYLIKDNIFF
jgi:hypothetical protein